MNIHEVMDANAKSMPKRGKEEKHEIRSIEHSRSSNGGHLIEHRFHNGNGSYKESETHTFGKDEGKKALAHFAEHAGLSEHLKGIEKKQEGEAGAEHAENDKEDGEGDD